MRIWRLWISWWSNGDLFQRSWVRFPPRSETFLLHWAKEVPDPVDQPRFLIHQSSVRPHLISALYIYTRCEESIHSQFHDILQCVGRCVDRESANVRVLVDCDSVVFSAVSVTCRPMRCRDQIR